METPLPWCDKRCEAHEALLKRIDDDLAAFPDGITKDAVDRALALWPENGETASVMISNGSMYFVRPSHQPWSYHMGIILREVWLIVQRARTHGPPLPDSEFLINSGDYGRAFASMQPRLPLLSITKEVGRQAHDRPDLNQVDILYPAGHYVLSGEVTRAIGRQPSPDVVRRLYRYPWEQKLQVALFRGRPHTHTWSRWALSRLMLEGDERDRSYLDIGLVWYPAQHDPFVVKGSQELSPKYQEYRARSSRDPTIPLSQSPEMNYTDHLKRKYLINLDGHSYAYRLLKLLATNSVVLKEESYAQEFYYHMLRPWVHYVPFHFKANMETARLEHVHVERCGGRILAQCPSALASVSLHRRAPTPLRPANTARPIGYTSVTHRLHIGYTSVTHRGALGADQPDGRRRGGNQGRRTDEEDRRGGADAGAHPPVRGGSPLLHARAAAQVRAEDGLRPIARVPRRSPSHARPREHPACPAARAHRPAHDARESS